MFVFRIGALCVLLAASSPSVVVVLFFFSSGQLFEAATHTQCSERLGLRVSTGCRWRPVRHLVAILDLAAGCRVISSNILALMKAYIGSRGSLKRGTSSVWKL